MKIKLVVKHAFGPYAIGDEIADAEEIIAAQASHPGYVVQADAKAADTPWIEDEPVAPEPQAKAPPAGDAAAGDKTKT